MGEMAKAMGSAALGRENPLGLRSATYSGSREALEKFVGVTPAPGSEAQTSNPYAPNYKAPTGSQGGTPVAGKTDATATDGADAEALDQRRRRAALILGSTEDDRLGT